MRFTRRRHRSGSSRSLLATTVLAFTLAVALPPGAAVLGAGATAQAAYDAAGLDFWVDSAMGPIKSRVFPAADGNTDRVVYALDGMRAREDLNGWENDTDVVHALTAANINVVMPVGGQSSFYADWNSASNFLGVSNQSVASSSGSGASQMFSGGPGKSYTYRWETFLTQDLPGALHDRLGFSPNRNGIFGLSMGGSAALTLAAYHPGQFSYAGSFSGYLNISAPAMRDAIRMAMVDAGGYNVDCMATPWDSKWQRMDPFMFAPKLIQNNTRLWISAGNALPTSADGASVGTVEAMALEALALLNTRAFQARMDTLSAKNITYDFPANGIHAWSYWQDELNRMLPDLSAHIG